MSAVWSALEFAADVIREVFAIVVVAAFVAAVAVWAGLVAGVL